MVNSPSPSLSRLSNMSFARDLALCLLTCHNKDIFHSHQHPRDVSKLFLHSGLTDFVFMKRPFLIVFGITAKFVLIQPAVTKLFWHWHKLAETFSFLKCKVGLLKYHEIDNNRPCSSRLLSKHLKVDQNSVFVCTLLDPNLNILGPSRTLCRLPNQTPESHIYINTNNSFYCQMCVGIFPFCKISWRSQMLICL